MNLGVIAKPFWQQPVFLWLGMVVLAFICDFSVTVLPPTKIVHYSRDSRLLQILASGSVHSLRGVFSVDSSSNN